MSASSPSDMKQAEDKSQTIFKGKKSVYKQAKRDLDDQLSKRETSEALSSLSGAGSEMGGLGEMGNFGDLLGLKDEDEGLEFALVGVDATPLGSVKAAKAAMEAARAAIGEHAREHWEHYRHLRNDPNITRAELREAIHTIEASEHADRRAYRAARQAFYTAFENFPAVKESRDAM